MHSPMLKPMQFTAVNWLYANAVKKHSEWIGGSKQREAFLIKGQPKQFTCTSFGNLMLLYFCFNY